eukprot:TRINITY_DN5264_c0_g1_i1.p1 TRINITY_DN5264_c0_g1~~TRINITY_DN5264_c0_g1_i1.p1  ORF type:complete len:205 (-),score=48.50 TRINITY_DN5264_c0_g1_i1:44-625(-)
MAYVMRSSAYRRHRNLVERSRKTSKIKTHGRTLERAQKGLYGGKKMLAGNKISFSLKKSLRIWKPNVQWKTFHSELLKTHFQVRVTTSVIRTIDKMGGIDNYILFTKEKKLDSKLGEDLRKLLIEAWEQEHGTKFKRRDILYQQKMEILDVENQVRQDAIRRLLESTTVNNDEEIKDNEMEEDNEENEETITT